MDSKNGDDILYLEVPLAICVCVIYVFVSIGIHCYKATYGHNPWIHESAVSCLFGLLVGGLINQVTGSYVAFNGNFFFYLILPPIIFSAGFSLKRKRFFQYIHQIALFGIVGTIVNFLLIAFGAFTYKTWIEPDAAFNISWNDAFLLASVLAGSDEVSAMSLVKIQDFPRMGALIFGEGVINDALSIVLFRTFMPLYNAERAGSPPVAVDSLTSSCVSLFTSIMAQLILSFVIGASCGLLNARMMKQFTFIRRFPIHQTSLVMLFGYLSYSVAEALNVSGILTLFIAAITLAHYSWHSLSPSSQIATRISFGAISDIAEGFAFSYVGLSLWEYTGHINYLFAFYMLLVVIFSRILTIYGLFAVFSCHFKTFDIPTSEQTGFILGGIVRGCLCWAQILQVKGDPVLVSTTLIIVLTTTLGCGFLLPILMPLLGGVKVSTKPLELIHTDAVTVGQRPDGIILIAAPEHYKRLRSPDSDVSRPTYQRSTISGAMGLSRTDEMEHGDGDSKWGQSVHADTPPPLSGHSSHYRSHDNSFAESTAHGNDDDGALDETPSSSIFVHWIWFDERIMKPIFGGSAPDRLRSHILNEADSPKREKGVSPGAGFTEPPSEFHWLDCCMFWHKRGVASVPPLSQRGEILYADFTLSRDPGDADLEKDGFLVNEEESYDLHSEDCSGSIHGRRGSRTANKADRINELMTMTPLTSIAHSSMRRSNYSSIEPITGRNPIGSAGMFPSSPGPSLHTQQQKSVAVSPSGHSVSFSASPSLVEDQSSSSPAYSCSQIALTATEGYSSRNLLRR